MTHELRLCRPDGIYVTDIAADGGCHVTLLISTLSGVLRQARACVSSMSGQACES